MATLLSRLSGFFRYRSSGVGEREGTQDSGPNGPAVPGAKELPVDGALQIATVWQAVEILSGMIASLPLFVYQAGRNGMKDLARDTALWDLLHESPNSRMTPFEFWRAITVNLLLRGNGYARLERRDNGEVFAMWPMAADQVEHMLLPDGSSTYAYYLNGLTVVLAESSVLHIKGLGNGITGLDRLSYMRGTTTEAIASQGMTSQLFEHGGKPAGVLMIDRVLDKKQREAVKANFASIAETPYSRLHLLEADMKYQQLNISPAEAQALETRRFSVEEFARWFNIPAVMLNHANVTTWGSGVESLIDGFLKVNLGPQLVNLQQAIRKRVLTAAQRARYSIEFSADALLRATLEKRIELYGKAINGGIYSPNEARQLENLPPEKGGDQLLIQGAMIPLTQVGQPKPGDPRNAAA